VTREPGNEAMHVPPTIDLYKQATDVKIMFHCQFYLHPDAGDHSTLSMNMHVLSLVMSPILLCNVL